MAADPEVPRSPSLYRTVAEDIKAALLGAPIPRVQRRWAGVYSEVDADGPVAGHALYHRAEVEPGVVLVTGPGGRGMTCSPAIAEETFS
jgi:glycine/D-amino acid oxidase-like deaminating enzyme